MFGRHFSGGTLVEQGVATVPLSGRPNSCCSRPSKVVAWTWQLFEPPNCASRNTLAQLGRRQRRMISLAEDGTRSHHTARVRLKTGSKRSRRHNSLRSAHHGDVDGVDHRHSTAVLFLPPCVHSDTHTVTAQWVQVLQEVVTVIMSRVKSVRAVSVSLPEDVLDAWIP